MNSLGELRELFQSLGKPVEKFTGYSFVSGEEVWGLCQDNPVINGDEMLPPQWKEYITSLKKAHKSGMSPILIIPQGTPRAPIVLPVYKPYRAPEKKEIMNIVTCPHCGKEGGEAGMKIHHFDKCKQKPAEKKKK